MARAINVIKTRKTRLLRFAGRTPLILFQFKLSQHAFC
jgi:hypothetical protein